jgi:pyruvate dehydrogenase E2 component (dihydrolipoamide acetyltransferase)
MVTEVILPKMGQTMEAGTIVDWLKEEGDEVKRGEVLFAVESDKATLEIEATSRGFLRKILVHSGETVPVLTVVGLMTRTADEPLEGYEGAGTAAGETEAGEKQQGAPGAAGAATAGAGGGTGRRFVSPRARMRAAEEGVDLAKVEGSGPMGRIVERDVLAYATARPKVTPVAARTAQALGVDVTAVSGTGPRGQITKADVMAAAGPAAVEPAPPHGGRRRLWRRCGWRECGGSSPSGWRPAPARRPA